MQATEHPHRQSSVSSSASAASARASAASSSAQPAYQPSQPQVLTDALKAQLAAANQQRRENLYPRLVQNLVTIEQNSITHSHSEERAMSLQQLAAANKARRVRLREAGYSLPKQVMA